MADNQQNTGDPNQRLSNAMYGTPKINPDEQRHYLGTFRERVALSMTVAQLESGDYLTALGTDLEQRDEATHTIFLNGNLGQEALGPYIRLATMHAVAFTIKNDPQYKTAPTDLALVIAAKKAIDVDPIDIALKYPAATTQSQAPSSQPSFWHRLFK
ncbi:YueI family protein [Furfurilactobacillus sp. WILCCON 0119]